MAGGKKQKGGGGCGEKEELAYDVRIEGEVFVSPVLSASCVICCM